MMNGPYIELLESGIAPSVTIVRHIYTRFLLGPVVIVTDNPKILLPSLKKQWLKLLRQVQRERSATLNTTRLLELTRMIVRMQGLWFSMDSLAVDTGVLVITVNEFVKVMPICVTLYVVNVIQPAELEPLSVRIQQNGLVVLSPESTILSNA